MPEQKFATPTLAVKESVQTGNPPPPPPPPTEVAPKASVEGDTASTAQISGAGAVAAVSSNTNSIRVKLSALEDIMNITGELVLIRNQLLQVLKSQTDSEFAYPLGRLNKITTSIQETAMKIRMQPIKTVWTKLTRIVRDLSTQLGKQIELKMIGEDTELDRQVLELIADPFVHIIRNCIDHGIELPDVRQKSGKGATGAITLNAYHEGGHVIIEVADDGIGVNTAKLREKLLAKGDFTQKELDKLTDDQVNQCIFKSGVSTAAKVTDVSGRGVGMDVVMTNIDKINGIIDLQSSLGKGTTIKIKIPLTLAIAPAFIVESAQDAFAVPQTNVLEILFGSSGKNHKTDHIDDNKVLILRDEIFPLISLQEVFGRSASEQEGYILILQATNSVFGLIVDSLLDIEEIVLKPIVSVLKGTKIFSGSTILGDGRVIMVVDPSGIAKQAGVSNTREIQNLETVECKKLTPILMFVNFRGETNAVDLQNVSRIEKVRKNAIESSVNGYVVQHNNIIIPVVFDGATNNRNLFLIVLQKNSVSIAFAVSSVIDVVDADLVVQCTSLKKGYLGSAVIDGTTTDILDSEYYLNLQDFANSTSFLNQTATASNINENLKYIALVSSNDGEISEIKEVLSDHFNINAVPSISGYSGPLPEVIVLGEYIKQSDCLEIAQKIKDEAPNISAVPLVKLFSNASKQDVASGIKAGILRYIPAKNKQTILQSIVNLIASRQNPGGD
ncbi:MAG: chemotaxis protein CheA [Holosporales bacterium]|nr:chemotaxis protein CheA [Holosporales bacterium]